MPSWEAITTAAFILAILVVVAASEWLFGALIRKLGHHAWKRISTEYDKANKPLE